MGVAPGWFGMHRFRIENEIRMLTAGYEKSRANLKVKSEHCLSMKQNESGMANFNRRLL